MKLVNWSKKFFLIVTAKHSKNLNLPSSIRDIDNDVFVTDEFKLLGVLIDNKLTFIHHIVNICKKENNKLFGIKRLAYLHFSVKIQFFKTFILPLFDYCLSVICYFSKKQIQKLTNWYNACLFKLFRFGFTFKDLDEIKF